MLKKSILRHRVSRGQYPFHDCNFSSTGVPTTRASTATNMSLFRTVEELNNTDGGRMNSADNFKTYFFGEYFLYLCESPKERVRLCGSLILWAPIKLQFGGGPPTTDNESAELYIIPVSASAQLDF